MVTEGLGQEATIDVCLLDVTRPPALDRIGPWWLEDLDWLEVKETSSWPVKVALGRAAPVREASLARPASPGKRPGLLSRRYDLTWCIEARGYAPVADLVSGPVVLDLQNLHSAAAAHKRRWLTRLGRVPRWTELVDDPPYVPGIVRRWRTWERRAVERCDRVVVCSDVDRGRLASPKAVTIANCYPRPARRPGDGRTADRPLRIGFVGLLDYQPNVDALRWFADDIFPLVRQSEPDAEFHVVGASPSPLTWLERPGVRLVGFVSDLGSHLRELTVLVAPIRFGGGTRVKIIEGFAHGIPVVSTAVGAEGIDCRDGEHLLLRDRPSEMAHAIVDIYRDHALRQRLVEGATRLYEARYSWEIGVEEVRRLARGLMSAGRDGERRAAWERATE
jgi:glycosyltransferase involved in cell wall biosynthesis